MDAAHKARQVGVGTNCQPTQDRQQYLKHILPQYIEPRDSKTHWFFYQIKKLKRFVWHFLLIFICQFMAIGISSFQGFIPPLYPPMGVAFVTVYLFGSVAAFALLLADIVAYLLQNFSIKAVFFYTAADIIPAFLVTSLTKNTFKTYDFTSNQWRDWLRFILITMGITCLMSASFRLPVYWMPMTESSFSSVLYAYIMLWLADINAILVLFSFSISWLYVMYSRGLKFKKADLKRWPLWAFLICFGFALGSLKSLTFGYWIAASMLLSLYLSYQTGTILGTALMYGVSILYFAYFSLHKADFIFHYGIKSYTLIFVVLFIYNISILCVANCGGNVRGWNGKRG
jgi:hypothetical protein